MASATWPLSLPEYFNIGVREERQEGFIRSSMDIGPSKQRKRFTATSKMYTGTMLLTGTQRATFETFYSTTINEGADAFDWSDPIDFTTQEFRFVEPPTFTALTGGSSGPTLWRLNMKVERLP